ncbi:hypothetical protein [Rufibacter roseus]|uniref:hypothetical protein n=1 Tax=Rufibacter roseus TaxID=1567108 RepID=UPI000A705DA6|nr:hypothetical protein [Rufibacter roseus]
MPISPKLEAKLSKRFAPDAKIEDTFAGNDLTFITDNLGNPITLFIGKRVRTGPSAESATCAASNLRQTAKPSNQATGKAKEK